jgi:phospholipid/cholesterol/gamma-HCH transport system substrate-binding protein
VRGRPRAALAAAAAAGMLVALAGCSSSGFNGIYSLPLPGGASLGSHPIQVTAQFANVANLVPQSAVRVNDVAVGRVTGISVPRGTWIADVTMAVNGSVHLPANAIAQVTQSGLLGEQYVALSAPAGVAAQGTLRNGSVISIARTTSNITVEQVLGALSLLLNDGGIGQLHTITTELNAALAGNEPQIRSMLVELDALLANLNAHRDDITTALDGLAALSATLRARDQQISGALTQLTPGLAVLARQRQQLVTMLDSLNALSGVAVHTINASQASFVADLKALDPTLEQLANAGQNLPLALQVLLTYPFTNQVLKDVKGDYLNAYLNVTAQQGTTVFPQVGPVYPTPSPSPTTGGSGH